MSLTAENRELLSLLAAGMTEKQIAEAAIVSLRTVQYKKQQLAKQLGITPRQLKWRAGKILEATQ